MAKELNTRIPGWTPTGLASEEEGRRRADAWVKIPKESAPKSAGQSYYYGGLTPPSSIAEVGQMLGWGAKPIIKAVQELPEAVGGGVQTAAYPVKELIRGYEGTQKTPEQLKAEQPPIIAPNRQSTPTTQGAPTTGDINAPKISSVPGRWHTNDNHGAYVQDGQTKGTFEVFPGTGGASGAGFSPTEYGAGEAPSTLTELGNWNIRHGTTGGGTYSEMSGPGRGSMTDEQWSALSNDERIARNVAAYSGAAKAEHDRWGQAMAAMDGREYDPTTGHIKGMDEGPLVIGQTGGFGILDNDYENRRRARMALGDSDKKGKDGATRAALQMPASAATKGKDPLSMGDVIDMAKLEEQGQYHNNSLQLDAQKARMEQQSRDRSFGLDEQRTTANVAETAQRMSGQRQEMLDKLLGTSRLSAPMTDLARTIVAQAPGVRPEDIVSILGEISGVDSPNGGLWGKHKYGELKEFSPKVQEDLTEMVRKRYAELKAARGGK